MNGTDPYERQLDRIPAAPPPEAPEHEVSPLAVRHDPSHTATPTESSAASSRGVAWIRPTELALRFSSSTAGRGIDLQSALSERARQAPAAIARATRRTTRSAIARPQTAAPEELGL